MAKKQILIVEDEGIVALDLQSHLKRLGYTVPGIACSGEEAISTAKEARPDLVMMDIKLEGEIDGIQAAEQIRAQFEIPVIYMTAYADEATLERAKLTEPFGYILKPFGERELSSTIETALYRHELERRLKQSEQWLAATLKSIGDAVIATDNQGRVKFINPVAEALTGWGGAAALGQDVAQVLHIIEAETRAAIENPAVEALRQGAAVRLRENVILVARDGRQTPIASNVAPIKDAKGDLTGVVLVFRDISRRKWTERLLQTLDTAALSMQKALTHQEIFDAVAGEFAKIGLSCFLFPLDEDRNSLLPRYLSYEPGALKIAEKIIGVARHDFSIPVQGIDVWEKVICERRTIFVERAEDVIRQVLPGPIKRFAGKISGILSSPKAIVAPLIVENQVIGLFSVQSDVLLQTDVAAITAFTHQVSAAWHRTQLFQQAQQEIAERKLAQDALRESEKRYRQLVEHAPAGIYEIDLSQGKFISVNDVMCEYTGYTKEEFLSIRPLDILTEESQALFFERQAKTLAHEPIPDTVEYKIRGKNQREFWVILNSRLEYDGDIPRRATIVVHDITQRKQAEEMMLQSSRMASVGRLAAGVAHEINNPLGGMMQSAQMLHMAFDVQRPRTRERLRAAGLDPAALERYLQAHNLSEYLDGIRSAGERAAKIITELLSFSRRASSAFAPHDLNNLIEQTLDLAAADYDLYNFREIEIARDFAPDLPQIHCDGQQIQQVVLNLVRNAAQAMAGGIEKGDREYSPRLTLRTLLAPDASFVRLEVEDNGPGIPEDIRTRLFEPFFTTRDVGEGAGLGLWVCWSIVVEQHKGRIWVEPVAPAPAAGDALQESAGASGSRFVVELPIK